MKLNIQLFGKKAEKEIEQAQEKEIEQEEDSADKIAELTINLDCEKEKYDDLKNKYDLLVKKYDDEHKANKRLMARINEKEEINEKIEEKIANKKAKITDLYDFKNGRLVLKK